MTLPLPPIKVTVPLVVSVPEACATLRIGRTHCYAMINAGKLKVIKIGRATRVTMDSINALVGEAPSAALMPAN